MEENMRVQIHNIEKENIIYNSHHKEKQNIYHVDKELKRPYCTD